MFSVCKGSGHLIEGFRSCLFEMTKKTTKRKSEKAVKNSKMLDYTQRGVCMHSFERKGSKARAQILVDPEAYR